jgi:hypothetical protein
VDNAELKEKDYLAWLKLWLNSDWFLEWERRNLEREDLGKITQNHSH